MKILSLCTSAGLWDRAWIEAGHQIIPGCEIMPHKRAMYEVFCGGTHMCHDLADLPPMIRGHHFDGIIGGIPCQSRSKLRAIREAKFPDLLPLTMAVLNACTWDWCLLENVSPLDIPAFSKSRLNAMHYAQPHQSRERWFTFSPNLTPPRRIFEGDVDDLLAYSVVAGRIYGPKRGSRLQGWPEFMSLAGAFPCVQMQEALADGVPRGLADAWIRSIEATQPSTQATA
ncbi:MAG TPA: DNA cytosine methyltransferase [Dongiaceae bacterium]|nr:DNA cytosine methyltransferase [Dongiaceae bacterium]